MIVTDIDQISDRNPEHNDVAAKYSRQNAATYRRYLDWARDPALIAWATSKAAAADMDAEAEEAMAAAIRARREQVSS